MIKVMSIIGTRPEAIKMAPVIKQLERHPDQINSIVCATGQHREIFDQALEGFGIEPDYDLDLMRPNQRLVGITSRIMTAVGEVIIEEEPDWVLVQGDTTTAMTSSLVAFYENIKIGHVEAGLRTGDRHQPFPEEINRRITDLLADLYFAPTESNAQNLRREGVDPADILVTGNTGIDALMMMNRRMQGRPLSPPLDTLKGGRMILVTTHRRENFGEPVEQICKAILEIASRYRDDVEIVFPVHPNPRVSKTVHRLLDEIPNIILTMPTNYETIVGLMSRATLILTDSGGIQEEAPSLGKPVLVLRDTTERPEAVTMGAAKIVGPHYDRIVNETTRLLDDAVAYDAMASVVNPYGDGQSSARIVNAILERSAQSHSNTAVAAGSMTP